MVQVNDNTIPTETQRKPGYWDANRLREAFVRLSSSIEEVEAATTIDHVGYAASQAEACFCEATACQQTCPLDKDVPKIMEMLRRVDFDLVAAEFQDLQDKLDVKFAEYFDKTAPELFSAAREGYIKEVNRIIDEKPELRKQLDILRQAYNIQVGSKDGIGATNPFPEFTGKLCPAPCETGGEEGPGCTLKESGRREPVRIRSTENDLHEIGYVMGWFDDMYRLPANHEQLDQSVAIVGAGPAGLQLAYTMAMQGYDVTIFEKDAEVGGQIYRGIPDHKIEKDKLAKYRLGLENMGVNVLLNTEATARDLEGFDAVAIATGVMDGQIEPTWVKGYEETKSAGLVTKAYDHLRDYSQSVETGNHNVYGPQTTLVYGDGYTAVDVVQTSIRQGYNNLGFTTVHAFRDTGVSDKVAGGFGSRRAMDDTQNYDFSTFKEDKKEAGVVTISGANIERMTPETIDGHTYANVEFSFQRPNLGFANVVRDTRRGETSLDTEAGGIYGDRGELLGVRLRDQAGNLQDYKVTEAGRQKFSSKGQPAGSVEGQVNGTLSLRFDKIVPAMGARNAALNSTVQELGVNAEPWSNDKNPDGIKNGVSQSRAGVFFAGDASGVEQLIVTSQADAKRVAGKIDTYLKEKAQGQEPNLAALAESSRATPVSISQGPAAKLMSGI